MNSKTNHTAPDQPLHQEDIDSQKKQQAPAYLEGTPIISGNGGKNKLMDSEEQEPEPDDLNIIMGTEADVSEEDISILEDAQDYMPTTDEEMLRKSALDNTDNEGDPLNEASFGEDVSGRDLDVPGSEIDDDTEDLGEEDEENNSYSLGGDAHD